MTAPAEHGINVPLLQKVLDYIHAHPDEHDQGWWAKHTDCGTTMCLAGHTVVMAGFEIDMRGEAFESGTCLVDGRHVQLVAAELLGLRDGQAVHLFLDCQTANDVWTVCEQLTHGEIQRPAVAS